MTSSEVVCAKLARSQSLHQTDTPRNFYTIGQLKATETVRCYMLVLSKADALLAAGAPGIAHFASLAYYRALLLLPHLRLQECVPGRKVSCPCNHQQRNRAILDLIEIP